VKLVLATLAAVLPAASQQIPVKLDTKATQINFMLGAVLHSVHGIFHLTEGEFWFDPSSNRAGGELSVDAKSGESGNRSRDSRMATHVLQANQYPLISFVPDRIDGKAATSGHSEFSLHGTLSVHGSAHELAMNVKSDIETDKLNAIAGFNIPYVQWGMKNPSTLMLRVEQTVHIEIRAVGRIGTNGQN